MIYPSYEARTPRATFTKKLLSMASRLDAQNTAEVAYPDGFVHKAGSEQVTVNALWVVGSYARGALTCGDLDLVLDCSARRCSPGALTRAFLGHARDVRVYPGTPESNESGVAHADAKLVWAPGLDWKAAIGSIQVDALATRFHRDTDIIPVRMEQLFMSEHQRDTLIALQNAGVVEWEFVPLDRLMPAELKNSDIKRLASFEGTAKQALLPYVQAFLTSINASTGEQDIDGGIWFAGGAAVALGRGGSLDVTLLDTPKFSAVGFMPYLNVRGPNGVWVIRRGPSHPLRVAARQFKGWISVQQGRADIACYLGDDICAPALVVEVFPTKQAFDENENEWRSHCSEEELHAPRREASFLEGNAFLDALAGAEGVDAKGALQFWDNPRQFNAQLDDLVDLRGKELPQKLAAALG